MNAERLFAFYDRISDNAEAVPRIRKFVLDLAIRGKLVKQDANDEPASEKLKKIAASRTKATKKDNQNTLEVSELSGLNFSLPLGWSLSRLSDLVQVLNGRAYKQDELLNSGTPVLRVGNLFTSNHWYYSNLELDENKYCDEGDLIYAWSASFGPFIWKGPRVIYHYHIWKLPLFSETHLSKQFLYFFLLQKSREIKDAGHGISMVHMTKKKMEQIAVPIPPLAEQQRIVAKIDEFMVLCDKLEEARQQKKHAQDRLTKASLERLHKTDLDSKTFKVHARFMINVLPTLTIRESLIGLLRQTILNLAIRGKLVEQKPADTPESELLAKITTQKRASQTESIHESLANLNFGLNKTSFEIPTNWIWATMETVALVNMGQSPPSEFYNQSRDGLPFFQGKADFGERHPIPRNWCTKPSKISECGDILLSVRAPVGPTNVTNRRCCIGRGLAALRPYRGYDLNFMLIVLRALESNLVALGFGTTFRAITKKQLTKFQVPVPPLAEQQSIVAKVDELLTVCDNLRSTLSVREERQIALQKSALHHILNQVSG